MKQWMAAALAGFLLGSALVYGVDAARQGREKAGLVERNGQLEEELAQLRKAQDENKARLESTEQSNRQMAEKLQSSTTVETEEAPPEEAKPAAPVRDREAERKAFAERAGQQFVQRWQGKLKLRPDQVVRLNQLLQAAMQNSQNGRMDPSAFQKELLGILSPEQKAEYDHIQNREAQARLEMRTNMGLSQVQSMFDLTDAQKDQVFQKLAALEQAAATSTGDRNSRQVDGQKKVEALKDILTPDQLKEYAESVGGQGRNRNGFGNGRR